MWFETLARRIEDAKRLTILTGAGVSAASGVPTFRGPAGLWRHHRAEDLATPESWSSPRSTRGAIEAMPEGVVVVAGTEGISDAGIFGDILCARMEKRGVAALVTEGAVRDAVGVRGTSLPVWCAAEAAPPSVAALTFVNWEEPVGCGGVASWR